MGKGWVRRAGRFSAVQDDPSTYDRPGDPGANRSTVPGRRRPRQDPGAHELAGPWTETGAMTLMSLREILSPMNGTIVRIDPVLHGSVLRTA